MHFTQSEMKSALENLDVAKAKGPDGLGNLPLKKLSNTLCKSLSLVFNTIANKRAYPLAWKTSEILPFFKDGDKQNVANYRFTSPLSCTSKLLETNLWETLWSNQRHNCPWTIRLPQKPIVHHTDDNVYEWNIWQPRFDNLSNHVLLLRKSLRQGLP